MKNKRIIAVISVIFIIVLCACLFVGCTKKHENMLDTADGVFKYKTLDELSDVWTLSTAESKNNSDVFTMNYDEDNNKYSVKIDTTSAGWASIGEKVYLTAGSYYRISYGVDISDITALSTGNNYDGVFVTFVEDSDFNYNTEKAVMQIESVDGGKYIVTFKAKETGYATLVLKVGTEDSPAKAVVTLNSLTLDKITKNEAKDNYQGEFATDYYNVKSEFNIFYIIVGGIFTALICYIAYFMFQRNMFKNESEEGYTGGLSAKINSSKIMGIFLVVGIALIIRLFTDILSTAIASTYVYSTMGYNIESITTQAMFLAKYGPANFDKSLVAFATANKYSYSTTGMPLQLYFLSFCGLLGRIFENTGNQYLATLCFIRFFCALADIGTAVIIYSLIKKSLGNVGATIIAALYVILPVVFATSSLWGYTESITVFLIVLSISFMLKNKYIPMASVYFVACMFSMSALFIAPMIMFYTVLQCIIDRKKIIPAAIILVLSFVVFYAINVPFDINYITNGKPFYCFSRAWTMLYKNELYSLNAFNFQSMLGNNFGAISTASRAVTIIFILFMLALIGIAYFKYKNRMNLLLMATAFINMMFVFCNNMNPMSMYISLALMLVYAILNKEKRIFFSFVVFAILMFVNVSYVELFVDYTATGVDHITANAMVYVFGAFELLAVLYYIFIVYDIVVSRKVRKIKPMPLSYLEWVDNFFKRIKKGYYKLLIKNQKKNNQ